MAKSAQSQKTSEHEPLSIDVAPGKMERLAVGRYKQPVPSPNVTLEIRPRRAEVVAKPAWLPMKNYYVLVYLFQNYGDVTCRVTLVAGSTKK